MKKTVKDVTIIGNNHEHNVLSFYELPKKYQKIMIDIYHGGYSSDMEKVMEYLNECSYVVYRKYVYNLSDTMRYSGDLGKYDGYNSDTFFSGQLFKYSEDCEQVFCFSFYS